MLLTQDIGIFFSKDRKEEVIEVVEDNPEQVYVPELNASRPVMSQGEWMKGCPEGGEQAFLFGLYNLLTAEDCKCPQGCGYTYVRKKSDFFTLFVSQVTSAMCLYLLIPVRVLLHSPSSGSTSTTFETRLRSSAGNVQYPSV
jgi:hypothetical protein